MDVILLAGGFGSRMEIDLPKAIVPAGGKSIIERQIDYFFNSPVVEDIVVSLGHRAKEVIDFVSEKYPDKIDRIKFCVEDEPLGTAGGIKLALKLCTSNKVAVLNNDDVTDISPEELNSFDENTICVANPRLPFGNVEESEEGYAVFNEKPILKSHWVNCGWYSFNREDMLNKLPDKGSIEYDVFTKYKFRVHKHSGFWATMNSEKEIREFESRVLPEVLK